MKAIVLKAYGTPDALRMEEVSVPTPKPNEVLISVRAVSINSWDWDIVNGVPFVNRLMAGLFKPTRIQILGCDVAGRVEAVGKGVTQFRVGDDVFGDISRSGWGGFAEYVCASEQALVHKPMSISYEQAAAMPQAGLLALQGLQKGGDVQAEQKVLINGASGGVGSFAVPMVKSGGAEVTGVCSTEKRDFVRSLGADYVIDYTQEDFTKNGRCYDLIIDVKGFHSLFDYKRALCANGRYVMLGGSTSLVNQVLFLGPWISMLEGKKMSLLLHKANKGLDEMIELTESGVVTPVIDSLYPLSETADAMRYFGSGKAKGKVVVSV